MLEFSTACTTTVKDILGRPLNITNPDGSQVSYAYHGLATTVTDARGHSTTSVADVWGRTMSVTPPTGPGVAYTYDPLGRLRTATRGGVTTTLTYDAAGRKLTMSDPDMGFWQYSYDALGNLLTQTDAHGCVLSMTYDALNRLTNKTSFGAGCGTQVNATYTYDVGANGKGRRTGMTDPSTGSGATTWTYDSRGRMLTETKVISGQSFTTSWSYNSADLPVTMTYPDGEVVTNTYSPQMLLETVSGWMNGSSTPYVTSTNYDRAGRMTGRALGNGLSQSYAYYPWSQQGGRLQTLSITGLQNLTYQYDLAENITRIQNSIAAETQAYTYDALDRLTGWTLFESTQTRSETYGYDPASGNLSNRTSFAAALPGFEDPLAAGLAAWWSMDESSGQRANRHGSNPLLPYGTVTQAAGQQGSAAGFSPSSPGHLRQESNALITTGNINFTLAAQVYLNSTTGTAIIANKGEKTNMNRRDYTLSVSNGILSFRVGNGSSTGCVSSGSAVTANAWHTVIAWHDAENDTLNLQIDNGTVFSAPYSGGASNTTYPLTVGAFADNTYVLNGRVDELALYKRLLTADERAWLHNNGQGRAYTDLPAPQLPPDVSLAYTYGDPAHAHAVTALGDNQYAYDPNGNQVTRNIANDGQYQLLYDAENRLVEVKKNDVTIAQFVYNGDGQ